MIQHTATLFETASRWLDRLTFVLAVPLGLFFVGIVFANVLARYVFSSPIIGSVEFARVAFVWATFIGAAMAVRRRSHIRLEFLAERLPLRARRVLALVIHVLIIAFLVFVAYHGWRLTGRVQRTFFPASGISQVYLYLPLPLSALVMLVHTFAHAFRDLVELIDRGDRTPGVPAGRPGAAEEPPHPTTIGDEDDRRR